MAARQRRPSRSRRGRFSRSMWAARVEPGSGRPRAPAGPGVHRTAQAATPVGVQEMSGLLRAAAGAERLRSVSEPPFWLSVEEVAAVAAALPAPAWARLARAVPEVAPPVVLVVPDRGHRRALAEVGAHRRRVAQRVTACLRPTIPGRPQETVGEVPAVPAAPVALSPRAAAVVAGSSVAEVVVGRAILPWRPGPGVAAGPVSSTRPVRTGP